jgi:23S rRNA (adenine2503-C2)-methyltransferase
MMLLRMTHRMRAAASPPAAPTATPHENLFGLDRAALESRCASLGEPAYRARQIAAWLYAKRVRSFEAMRNLPRALREALAARHVIRWPEVDSRLASRDGTVKYLLRLGDGATVECVMIPEARRRTICLSTQVGCPLKCAFCLTGLAGYRRNLGVAEIVGQVAIVLSEAPPSEHPWNVVVMGMGEPLLNYEPTLAALRTLMDPDGFGIPPRRVTLSTVGLLPGLRRLMEEPLRPNLAVSLHAASAELRRRLMPVEAGHPLREVLELARHYPAPRGGRVTFEYVLLKGVNDSPAEGRRLVRLLADFRAKVNLIPFNPAPGLPFEPPTPEGIDAFASVLAEARITVAVRQARGQDILAACGQLHLLRSPGGEAGAVS